MADSYCTARTDRTAPKVAVLTVTLTMNYVTTAAVTDTDAATATDKGMAVATANRTQS